MINFPFAPTIGQQFSAGVKTWIWTGVAWDLMSISDAQVALAQAAAAAAAASALTIGTTAAFSTANPLAKDASDITKQFKVKLSGLATGVTAELELTKSGEPLMTTDVDKSRNRSDLTNATNSFVYGLAGYQRWSPGTSGTQTLAISGWPAAPEVGKLVLEVVNGGAATLAWPAGATFITSGGLVAANFAASGIVFPASGTRRILLWSVNGGTTVFIKGA